MRKLPRTSLVLATCTLAAPAQAHALLDSATPAVGSHLSQSPPSLTLRYSGAIEANFSRVELHAPDGTAIPITPTPAATPAELQEQLPPLPPGKYQVIWHVTSTDGHMTQGRFSFTVDGQ